MQNGECYIRNIQGTFLQGAHDRPVWWHRVCWQESFILQFSTSSPTPEVVQLSVTLSSVFLSFKIFKISGRVRPHHAQGPGLETQHQKKTKSQKA
jgi:hypothetical protein